MSTDKVFVSAWLPLGINNLTEAKNGLEHFLAVNTTVVPRKKEPIFLTEDDYFQCNCEINLPVFKNDSLPLALSIRIFGWGYYEFSLALSEISSKELGDSSPPYEELDPSYIFQMMDYLLLNVPIILSHILLEHQNNYFFNVIINMFSEHRHSSLVQQTCLEHESLKDTFRHSISSSDDIDSIKAKRSLDLLVKIFVIDSNNNKGRYYDYDTRDQDFGNSEMTTTTSFMQGKNRTTLLVTDNISTVVSDISYISSSNCIIRMLTLLENVMSTLRHHLILIRNYLVGEEEYKIEISKILDININTLNDNDIIEYFDYLQIRAPLLNELVDYIKEAVSNCDELIDVEKRKSGNYKSIGILLSHILNTVERIIKGIDHEIESIEDYISNKDETDQLSYSRETRDLIKIQTNTQKRSFESQYITGEFARIAEVRAGTAKYVTQITTAVAIAGLGFNFFKAIVEPISVNYPMTGNYIAVGIAALAGVGGFLAAGFIASQLKHKKGLIEITCDLSEINLEFHQGKINTILNDNRIYVEKLCKDNSLEVGMVIERMRIDTNIYRTTWEDRKIYKEKGENEESIKRILKDKIYVTLEYEMKEKRCMIKSIMVSIEKPAENDNIDDAIIEIIEFISKRIEAINEKLEYKEIKKYIETNIGRNKE
jgi:hypothetical protein